MIRLGWAPEQPPTADRPPYEWEKTQCLRLLPLLQSDYLQDLGGRVRHLLEGGTMESLREIQIPRDLTRTRFPQIQMVDGLAESVSSRGTNQTARQRNQKTGTIPLP
eukprot:9882623-Heterocapsa_arctica.AAC.1